jgi:hypothetical protein
MEATSVDFYLASKASIPALKDRIDHRVRIRIAEIKQLYNGQELISLSQMGTDIVCSILIVEKRKVEDQGIQFSLVSTEQSFTHPKLEIPEQKQRQKERPENTGYQRQLKMRLNKIPLRWSLPKGEAFSPTWDRPATRNFKDS